MSIRIPLAAVPSQTLSVNLGGQSCQIAIYQKETGVFLDLARDNIAIVTGAICRDRVSVVREEYRTFAGLVGFVDTQGESDPDYTGFGTRYQLAYIP